MPTMPSRPSSGAIAPRIDAARPPAPIERAVAPAEAPPAPASRLEPDRDRRPRIVVKGSGARPASPGSNTQPLEYPVQTGKIQSPPLRDDTLARERLLDWLSVKIHSRVV